MFNVQGFLLDKTSINKKWASDLYHAATTKLPLLHSCPDGVQRELAV